jgi:hypothetical protein
MGQIPPPDVVIITHPAPLQPREPPRKFGIKLDKKKDKDEDSVDMFAKINTMLSDMTIGTVAMAVGVPTLFVFLLYRIIR